MNSITFITFVWRSQIHIHLQTGFICNLVRYLINKTIAPVENGTNVLLHICCCVPLHPWCYVVICIILDILYCQIICTKLYKEQSSNIVIIHEFYCFITRFLMHSYNLNAASWIENIFFILYILWLQIKKQMLLLSRLKLRSVNHVLHQCIILQHSFDSYFVYSTKYQKRLTQKLKKKKNDSFHLNVDESYKLMNC